MFNKDDRVLVVAAHPDDEVLGMGGTIAQAAHFQKATVFATFLTDGYTSRVDHPFASTHRQIEAKAAGDVLGVRYMEFWDYPDQRLDTIPVWELAREINRTVRGFEPTYVFTHIDKDLNLDHQVAHSATMVAVRKSKAMVLGFPVISSPRQGGWLPNAFINIATAIELKIAAMEKYQSELQPGGPRSRYGIETEAQYWGLNYDSQWVEPFEIYRMWL